MSSATRKKNRNRMEKWKMEALLEKKEESMPEDGQECKLSIPADGPIEDISIPTGLEVLDMPKLRPILVSNVEYDSLQPEETVKRFARDIRAMLERYEANNERLIEVENEIQDAMHAAEMYGEKQNASQRCASWTKFMNSRKERRRCKNENALLQPIYDMFHGTILLDRLAAVQGECGKIKRSISAKGYSLRTDIFDDIM